MPIEETLDQRPEGAGPRWLRRTDLRVFLAILAFGVGLADSRAADQGVPAAVRAHALHDAGITGRGITIAVIGGGRSPAPEIARAADGHDRLLAVFDALSGSVLEATPVSVGGSDGAPPGVLEVMLSSRRDDAGRWEGIAPNADLVMVAALDAAGTGRPIDLARGIGWVVENRDRYGIRVLSLPLAGPRGQPLGQGPLDRTLMDAWAAGIVVVVAAGNGGPGPATISAPGELPEVITVGAVDPGPGGFMVSSYSSSGPTLAGFIKPELVAPAGPGEIVAPHLGAAVHRLPAGTSVSTAVVSGVVALVLEASPWLTPDEVKRRLVATARPALSANDGESPLLRQGAGVVDALDAAVLPAARGATWSDLTALGITWSDLATLGITWSDLATLGITWSDLAALGITWSDLAALGITWSDLAARGFDQPDAADRGSTWSD